MEQISIRDLLSGGGTLAVGTGFHGCSELPFAALEGSWDKNRTFPLAAAYPLGIYSGPNQPLEHRLTRKLPGKSSQTVLLYLLRTGASRYGF